MVSDVQRLNSTSSNLPISKRRLLATTITALLLSAHAAVADDAVSEADSDRDELHTVELDRIEIRAMPLGGTTLDSAQPVDVLAGELLNDRTESTLGETLQFEPGIQTTYFGPGAGRPIIRSQGGSRVRVTEDGLSSLDASALSPDHAVTAEPLLIDRIEILRGPANLLYGSTASGGVVNLIDNRIPEQPQDFSGAVELRGNSVADERAGVARIDGGVGAFQFHISGFARETNDYEVPGFALSADERAELDEDERAELERGRLVNSAQESDGATLGVSLAGDWGFAGVAWKTFDTVYGIPEGAHAHEHEHDHEDDHDHGMSFVSGFGSILGDDHGHDHEHDHEEEEQVTIDLKQDRYEFRSALFNPVQSLEEIRFSLATNDYEHIEFEGDEVGTLWAIDSTEMRLQSKLAPMGRYTAVFGVQYEDAEVSALGDEAFIPPATTESLGIFLLNEYDLDPVKLSAGLRWQDDEIQLDDGFSVDGIDGRDFTAVSVSAGAVWRFAEQWQATANWQRSERSPNQEELFANGPHIATQAFEIGNPLLDEEVSNNFDFGIHKYLGNFHFRADVFFNSIDDFVYLMPTGEEEDELPVQIWTQQDAEFLGFEVEASYLFPDTAFGDIEWRVFADAVDADLDGAEDLPRIAPGRVGVTFDWHRKNWRSTISYYRVFEQDEVASFETETDGYNMLSANVAYLLTVDTTEIELFLRGSNLTNETQRVHTSFLKEFAPLPGRNITGGVRVRF